MQEQKLPYEFLARWDANGVLSGAQIGFRRVITDDDGTAFADQLLPAQPVALAGETGFPLGDLLPAITQNALIAKEAAETALAAVRAELAAVTAERDALRAQAPGADAAA